jgi:FkbM family methyltransferase
MDLSAQPIRTASVAGFTVQYLHDEEYRLLVSDIFTHEEYRFDSRARRPRVLDCGAHIGLSVLYVKRRFPEARITAFEPNPLTFQLLTRNIRGNGFDDVELVNAAVAVEAGALPFYVPRDPLFKHWGDSAVKNPWYNEAKWETITVPAIALRDRLTEPIDYLKLDIEGLETDVLRASTDRLAVVKRATVEFHGSETNPANQLPAMRALLAEAGLTTILRQGHWLTREADLQRVDPYTLLVHAYRSRLDLAWFLRRDVVARIRARLRKAVTV